MISIIFALKLVLFFFLGVTIIANVFYVREVGHMEKRLGVILPASVKALSKLHLYLGLFLLAILGFFLVF